MTNNGSLAVIFDLDGVLVDTSDFHKAAWMKAVKSQGWNLTEEDFLKTFGMQNREIINYIVGRQVDENIINEVGEAKEVEFRRLIKGKAQPLDGVENLIKNLVENGFLLAVGSSAPRENVDILLSETGLLGYFTDLVTSADISRGKPAPDTFLKAAQKLGTPPGRCAVVEDAIPGVEAAINAKMKVVAVTNTRKAEELTMADLVVDSLSKLDADSFKSIILSDSVR